MPQRMTGHALTQVGGARSTTYGRANGVLMQVMAPGRHYLHGHVANKDAHDRLLQMIEWMVRNNDSGYYDGVEYPGKSNETGAESAASNGDEQMDEREPE